MSNWVQKIQEAELIKTEPGKHTIQNISLENFRLIPVKMPRSYAKISVDFIKNSCQTLQLFLSDSEAQKSYTRSEFEYGIDMDLSGALHDFNRDTFFAPEITSEGTTLDLTERVQRFVSEYEVENMYLNVYCPYWNSGENDLQRIELNFNIEGGSEPVSNSGTYAILVKQSWLNISLPFILFILKYIMIQTY